MSLTTTLMSAMSAIGADVKKLLKTAPTFRSRAEAEQATVDDAASVIFVKTPTGRVLTYVRDTGGTALTTQGGVTWSPDKSFVSPQHFAENTLPGTTDMIDAMEEAVRFCSKAAIDSFSSMHGPNRKGAYITYSGLGEELGISRPWTIGAFDRDFDGTWEDDVSGVISNVHFKDAVIVALSSFNTQPLATYTHATEGLVTTVPNCAVFLGVYDGHDRNTAMKHKGHIAHVKFDMNVNCNFVTSGMYFHNTFGVYLHTTKVYNLAKNGFGFGTSCGALDLETPNYFGTVNYLGFRTKNIVHFFDTEVHGAYRYAGQSFPTGEDATSMNATAYRINSADCRLVNCTSTNVYRDLICDGFNNGHLTNPHFWGGGVVIGPNCEGMIISDVYADFGSYYFYSYTGHHLSNFNLRAGQASLYLVANQVNATGANMVIAGLNGNNGSVFEFTEDTDFNASYTWADEDYRSITLTGVNVEETPDLVEYIPNSRKTSGVGLTTLLSNSLELFSKTADAFSFKSRRGIILNADADVNSSIGTNRSVILQSRGVDKIIVRDDGVQILDEVTGTAVQDNPLDTASHKMLKHGAHGLGAFNAPFILDLNAVGGGYFNGFYLTSPDTTGDFPTVQKFGLVRIYNHGNTYWQEYSNVLDNATWTRHYRAGIWSDWVEILTSESTKSVVSGSKRYVKSPSGVLTVTDTLTLNYESVERLTGNFTYPETFIANPVVSVNLDLNSANDFTTPVSQLGITGTRGEGLAASTVNLYRINGAADFQSGDTATVRVSAVGFWK